MPGPNDTTSPGPAGGDRLSSYARSLLRIKLPVRVTLARARRPIRSILEIAPGSMLQFEKSCEETLELEVGQHNIAEGEAVKVGDKFGLRLLSIRPPQERFQAIRPDRQDG